MKPTGLYQIFLSYAVFGIYIESGIVTDAAPIASWMIGKNILNIKHWLKSKGAKAIKV